uniref:Uncharacterized protein n=1 Tax=viral metagenome TaxID=1070528 RepID=A0A6C0IJV6_9ZZZZ
MSSKAKVSTAKATIDLRTEYINQLSAMEKTVLKIAQEHLETSFSLEKSIGFKSWVQGQAK